jgi:hypothetical protein
VAGEDGFNSPEAENAQTIYFSHPFAFDSRVMIGIFAPALVLIKIFYFFIDTTRLFLSWNSFANLTGYPRRRTGS